MEQINRALKTDLGLGTHQVSAEEGRLEKSFGIAVLAYLLLSRACPQEILPGTSWSLAQLQHALRFRIITNQGEHHVKTRLTKARYTLCARRRLRIAQRLGQSASGTLPWSSAAPFHR